MSNSNITVSKFGETNNGDVISLHTISSDNIQIGIINYGAAIQFLRVPDKNGHLDDIVTGFETLPEYFEKSTYFGSTVGRFANRIANGKFAIDGKQYTVSVNNGPNSLHGGFIGFDKKMWKSEVNGNSVIYSLISGDGEEGFPGEVNVSVSYTLFENQLIIKYHATSTKATPINLTNHSFFNLGGHDNWDVDLSNHEIYIPADAYLPTDGNCLVTGEIKSVEGTIFDLRTPVTLTPKRIAEVPGQGYDHNYCFQRDKKRHLLANVKHIPSGRVLIMESTEPGMQFYSGNFLSGMLGKRGVSYTKHSAFCLEDQNWPDAVNHRGVFPDSILSPSGEYNHTTWMKFETI